MARGLVGIGDTGEMRDLAGQRLLVESLDVSLGQNFDRALDVDFHEVGNARAHFVTYVAVGGNGGRDGDHTVAGEHFAHPSDAADVDVAVLLAEAEAFGEVGAYHVAVKDFDLSAERAQTLFEQVGDGALPRPGHSGEPDSESFMHAGPSRPRGNGCRTLCGCCPPTTSVRHARPRRAGRRE